MISLKNIHFWGSLGLILQLLFYVPYFVSFHMKDYREVFLIAGFAVSFLILCLGQRRAGIAKKTEIPPETSTDAARQAVKVLSSLYAVIAGLSLTTAIREISRLDNALLGIESTLVFFSTAVPFYVGATMFLVRNYYVKGFEGKTREPLIDFFMLFFEAIALYGMAVNVANLLGFIVFFFILLITDALWVLYLLVRKWRQEVPPEWLWLDFYMLAFLWTFWFFAKPSPAILAIASISRTVTDYVIAARYYLPS